MTTLNHLIYDIKNIIYGGRAHDDAEINDRQIAYWVTQVRAMLIRQELFAKTSIHDSWVQHLIVTMDQADTSEACGINTGCYILKSTQAIPRTIRRNSRNTITAVQSIDETTSFSETSIFRKKFNEHNKYTGSKSRWYLKNDYLYITNSKVIEKVSLSGIFEDPSEVARFTSCSGTPCFTNDTSYPVSADMASKITDIIVKTKATITAIGIDDDDTNDAKDKKEHTK